MEFAAAFLTKKPDAAVSDVQKAAPKGMKIAAVTIRHAKNALVARKGKAAAKPRAKPLEKGRTVKVVRGNPMHKIGKLTIKLAQLEEQRGEVINQLAAAVQGLK